MKSEQGSFGYVGGSGSVETPLGFSVAGSVSASTSFNSSDVSVFRSIDAGETITGVKGSVDFGAGYTRITSLRETVDSAAGVLGINRSGAEQLVNAGIGGVVTAYSSGSRTINAALHGMLASVSQATRPSATSSRVSATSSAGGSTAGKASNSITQTVKNVTSTVEQAVTHAVNSVGSFLRKIF